MSTAASARPLARREAAASAVLLPLLVVALAGCRDTTALDAGRDAAASHRPSATVATPAPTSVTIAGNLQTAVGCSGDWQPDCAYSHLTYDATDDVWQGTFSLPAGSYEYKAALNDGWTENYGLNAQPNGANVPLALAASGSVAFFYDHKTHWVTDDHSSVIATAPGSYQSALGCPGDWDPSCLRSWLEDPDGDGTYGFETTAIPAGAYEVKVAIGQTWIENYGQGGAQNGANIPFTVAQNGSTVSFAYVATTHVLTVQVTPPVLLAQTITFTSTPPASGTLGGTYAVSATASSGLAVTFSTLTSTVCTLSGSTVTFVAVGTCTVAADQAGDATYAAAPRVTQTIPVGWPFTGFLSPVMNPPALNDATAGATIPIKFSLGGDRGLAIFAAGSPSSARASCPAAAAVAIASALSPARKNPLTYDAATGVYTYSWVTNKSWANSCRTLTVTLVDGTAHLAEFRFR